MLHVSTRKGLFTLERGAAGWAVVDASFVGDPVTLVLPHEGGVLAALDLGHFGPKLRHRAAGASDWEELDAPTYPPKPDDHPDKSAWSLKKIWALARGGDGTWWMGTIPGGLFRTDDPKKADRQGWTLVRSLWDRPERLDAFGGGYDQPGIHSICVHPTRPEEVVVGVSCGGVWRTVDGGETWSLEGAGLFADYMPGSKRDERAIQDPHAIRRCAAAPDVLWMQHHNGAFRSTDGGCTWSSLEVPPSAFGFPVAAHPKDPRTAFFVPAVKDECRVPVDGKVCVARTRDGGESFEVLREGLPQEHAYDLVYRHAFDIDASGDVLAMGSTTGSLWVSEDAGDHWTHVSAHLPPVYAVCFA